MVCWLLQTHIHSPPSTHTHTHVRARTQRVGLAPVFAQGIDNGGELTSDMFVLLLLTFSVRTKIEITPY